MVLVVYMLITGNTFNRQFDLAYILTFIVPVCPLHSLMEWTLSYICIYCGYVDNRLGLLYFLLVYFDIYQKCIFSQPKLEYISTESIIIYRQ